MSMPNLDKGADFLRLSFAKRDATRLGLTLLLSLLACGCDQALLEELDSSSPETSPVTFARDTVCIFTPSGTIRLQVEIAEDAAQRAYGLMDRDTLAPDAGMLFIYPELQPADHGFWMFRTKIPLDIAYLDLDGRIIAMRQMPPCPHPTPQRCARYPAGVRYAGALEVNQGFFAAHNVTPAARIVRAGEPGCSENIGSGYNNNTRDHDDY